MQSVRTTRRPAKSHTALLASGAHWLLSKWAYRRCLRQNKILRSLVIVRGTIAAGCAGVYTVNLEGQA